MVTIPPPTAVPARAGACTDAVLGLLAGTLLFGMMLLTFVDVVMRYGFNAPLRGSFEVTEIMMAILIFAGLPLVSRKEEHVTIDTFDRFIPATVRRVLRFATQIAIAVVLGGMGWLLYQRGVKLAGYGDVTQTLRIPLAPFVHAMAALTVVTALVHLAKAFAPPPAGDGGAGVV
jgi:TRAP-type C4-dicarboxylate transport system permease small subunit